LDAGEDEKVLQLMAQRKRDIRNKVEVDAESKDEERHDMEPELEWKVELLRLRSKELIDEITDRFRH
jgi:hypothetical protein